MLMVKTLSVFLPSLSSSSMVWDDAGAGSSASVDASNHIFFMTTSLVGTILAEG